MLKPQYIAIPIFAILIAIEAFALIKRNHEFYNRKDAWTNIGVGFISTVFGTLFGLITGIAYLAIYNATPLKMPMYSVWPWVILVLFDDFLYYCGYHDDSLTIYDVIDLDLLSKMTFHQTWAALILRPEKNTLLNSPKAGLVTICMGDGFFDSFWKSLLWDNFIKRGSFLTATIR